MRLQNFISPLLIIIFAVVLRLVPHPANFAPIAAMALFGGVYLNKRYALIIPAVAMFLSDIFLGFHNTMLFVYGSFLLTGVIGLWLRKQKTITNIIGASLISSLFFFLITNFGVWLVGGLYAKTFTGLVNAYFYAIPFFRNTIIGDLFYIGVFFGSYEMLLKALNPKHQILNTKEYQNTNEQNSKRFGN